MRTPKPAPNDPRVLAIQRAQEKLRKKSLPRRTSTYVEGSIRQTQGSYAEAEAQRWLQDELTCAGAPWTVLMWQEARRVPFGGCGPFDGDLPWVAIDNSRNGDLYVYKDRETYFDEPKLLFSVEVKSSAEWPSASINYSELFNGSARYLLGVTTAGTWICTMDEARKHARLKETHRTSFYTVDPAAVKTLTIKEIIDAQEATRREEPIGWDPNDTGDVPF